jgi:2-dehydropantoate 2-reductase
MLQRSGREVHFLLRSDYEQVKRHGLKIVSVNGNFRLDTVNAYSSPEMMPPCDVVLVALKTTHNNILPKVLSHLVKKNGVVIIMQNGLGVEEEVAGIVGADRVMGGLCFICSIKKGPGIIQHLDYGHVTLGEYSVTKTGAGFTARLKAIARDFEDAGVTINQTDNLGLARWKKLVWNVPYNGLSVVLSATTKELVDNPESRVLVVQLMEEITRGAASCGYKIEKEIVQNMLSATETMIPYRPSMKIDFDEKRPMEVKSIYGKPLETARKNGMNMPSVAMLYQELQFLDGRNLGESIV